MNLINRALIIVVPQQPFIDWLSSVDEEGPELDIEDPRYEYLAYLINNSEDDSSLARALKSYHRIICEQELEEWYRDRKRWLPKRDLRTFKRRFEVRLSSMVWDLSNYPLEVEEFEK